MRRSIFLPILIALFIHAEAQVNTVTGSAEQGFPLINYTDTKSGMTLQVGLFYSSGNGLLVNEIASNIGTGWSLDAGGVIMRVQNGEPDDQQAFFSGDLASDDQNVPGVKNVGKSYPDGYLYNPNTALGCNQGKNYYPVFKENKVYKERNIVAGDTEQDKFIFRMNGRAGAFVLGKNSTAATLGDSRMKITFSTQDLTSQGIRTRINQFTIVTEDGLKYVFSDLGLTRICRYKLAQFDKNGSFVVKSGNGDDADYAVNRFYGFPLDLDERPFVVNSWYLTAIENTNNGQKIYFNYQNITSDVLAGKIISHQRNLNYLSKGSQRKKNKQGEMWFKYLSNPTNADQFSWDLNSLSRLKPATTSLVYSHSITTSKRITSIILPNQGLISFIYQPKEREDLSGEHALGRVEYIISNKLIRAYELTHGYFYKNSVMPYYSNFTGFQKKFARLCLLSLRKLGNGDDNATEPPYLFEYYTGYAGRPGNSNGDDIVPARNYLSQDHWGYYNGFNSEMPLTEDHDKFNDERTMYFKAVLPKFKIPKSGYAKNGLLKKVFYPTGGYLEYKYVQNVPPQNLFPAGYPQLSGGVSVSETVLFDGYDVAKNIITTYSYKLSNGLSSRWGEEKPYYYSYDINKFDLKFSRIAYNKPGLQYPEMAVSTELGKILGKALITSAIAATVQIGIQAILEQVWSAAIPYVNMIIFAYSIVKLLIEFLTPLDAHRFILSNVNNALQNPLPVMHSMVEVKNNSPNGNNGRTVYQFTDLADFPAIVPKMEWPFVQSQRVVAWAYGLPKKVTVYDKDNDLIAENITNYKNIQAPLANSNYLNCNCATILRQSQKGNKWEDYQYTSFAQSTYSWMTPRRYYGFTGRADLVSTIEKSYTTNGNLYFSSSTVTTIDPMTLLQKGKIIQKDAQSVIISLSYYPTDYTSTTGAIGKLKENNAIHIPISTETWKIQLVSGPPSTYTMELLDATVTEFQLYTFGTSPNTRQEVKPFRTYRLKSKAPVALATVGMHNPNSLLRVPSLYKQISEMTYDTEGNLIQTVSDDNIMSYINDYSSRNVVATVVNAAHADIAYAGFESNGSGNWTYNPAFIKTTFSLTGLKSFQLGYDPSVGSTSTIARTTLPGKSYTLTYWLRYTGTESVLVNGQTGELVYTGPDGWRLYQHQFSETASVSITGTGLIDELRLYPTGALMSTASYKEGIGIITECDANNRFISYEYDALGRLKTIRDQNRNIIKTYEYNYKK
ncbi:MAG: hypothetical protein J0M30_02775 [Chitinophagales bacterium]|nr:hypothetical protein [Chitinophagales bacterium]